MMADGEHIDNIGTIRWCKNGLLHREDGPAKIWPNGDKHWYRNGQRHREDGPAIVLADGEQQWYRNGDLHREDGPALIYPDGEEQWYANDVLHRVDGPAISWPANNFYAYYVEGVKYLDFKEYARAAQWTDKQLAEYLLSK